MPRKSRRLILFEKSFLTSDLATVESLDSIETEEKPYKLILFEKWFRTSQLSNPEIQLTKRFLLLKIEICPPSSQSATTMACSHVAM